MKVLFLSSTYTGVYYYLDKSILKAFSHHGITTYTLPEHSSAKEIKKAINEFNPDFIFTYFGRGKEQEVKRVKEISNVPLLGWFCEDPYFIEETRKYIHDFTIVFTVEKSAATYYRSLGKEHAYYLPLGVDLDTYSPKQINSASDKNDLCLIGHPYANRVELVQFILRKRNYNITLVGGKWSLHVRRWLESERVNCINYWIPPERVAMIYTNTKIVLNPHRPMKDTRKAVGLNNVVPTSPNNRCFEIAACIALQLCDNRYGIKEAFSPVPIPTYNSLEEGLQLMDTYLADGEKRNILANQAFNHVTKHHTFSERLAQILSQAKELL